MQIRNITINTNKHVYGSSGSFTVTYNMSGSKVFDIIDVWVFKDKMGNPDAIRIGASFKKDFSNHQNVIQNLFSEFRGTFVLNQINTNRLPFNEISKSIAKKFVDSICEAEQLDKSSLNFFMDAIFSESEKIKPAHEEKRFDKRNSLFFEFSSLDASQEAKDKDACLKVLQALQALKTRRFNQPVIHVQHIESNSDPQINDNNSLELSTKRSYK